MNERITVDPSIHHGAPVIKGTRVPVATIVGNLAGGMSKQDVAQDYGLQVAEVEAALEYSMTIDASALVFSRLDAEEDTERRS